MEALASAFPTTRIHRNALHLSSAPSFLKRHCISSHSRKPNASIRPPPPGFDYRLEILEESRSSMAEAHPELMDLVECGSLVLLEKRQFGPVPAWRTEFVEPEQIWLLGTSHISLESAADVERVVRAVRPDNVVVELCRSRAGIMYASNDTNDTSLLKLNMFSLSGAKFFAAINRSINLGGQSALALRLLLAFFSSKISSDANRPFGNEFRAAWKASEEIGAQIVLGDRPIEITLKRAWSSLKWSEKFRMLISLFRGITSQSSELPDSLKDQELDRSPFELFQQLSVSYPSLVQPLIHERDMYLAWSLKRSKAVNSSRRIVGVIGKGHMNGVVYALISDQGNLRFRDLVGRTFHDNADGWIGATLKNLLRDTILGVILWSLYEQLKTVLE